MPPKRAEPMRSDSEAWDMAVENKELVYWVLNRFLNSHYNAWYDREGLEAELESYAWEGMFNACKFYNPEMSVLSTYAVPSIERKLLRGHDVLLRMGGSSSGNYKKGETAPGPIVYSLDAIAENINSSMFSMEDENRGYDFVYTHYPQPWKERGIEPSFEDAVVNEIHDDQLFEAIFIILEDMPEPHRTIFYLSHLKPRETELPPSANPTRLHSGTHTFREVGEMVGLHKTTVRDILLEAEEYVRNHLKTEGLL